MSFIVSALISKFLSIWIFAYGISKISLFLIIHFSKLHDLFYVYEYLVWMWICALHSWLVPMGVRTGLQISWNRSYWWLGNEPGPFVWTSALNCQAVSQSQQCVFYLVSCLKYKFKYLSCMPFKMFPEFIWIWLYSSILFSMYSLSSPRRGTKGLNKCHWLLASWENVPRTMTNDREAQQERSRDWGFNLILNLEARGS